MIEMYKSLCGVSVFIGFAFAADLSMIEMWQRRHRLNACMAPWSLIVYNISVFAWMVEYLFIGLFIVVWSNCIRVKTAVTVW